jgi:hypothetical protein
MKVWETETTFLLFVVQRKRQKIAKDTREDQGKRMKRKVKTFYSITTKQGLQEEKKELTVTSTEKTKDEILQRQK